jgi:hypothetical protein
VTTTTTISTSTINNVNPSPTSVIVFADTSKAGDPLVVVSNYVQWSSTASGTPFALSTYGGSPSLAGQPDVTLHLHTASYLVGVLYFETAATAAANSDPLVTCSVAPATGILTCQATKGAYTYTRVMQCGAYIYLATSAFTQSGCTQVNLKLKSS